MTEFDHQLSVSSTVRPSGLARFNYVFWAAFGAALGVMILGTFFGTRSIVGPVGVVGALLLVSLFLPTVFMRATIAADGLAVRNYGSQAFLPWSQIVAVRITRPPLPSLMRRLGWVVELRTADGQTVAVGASIRARPDNLQPFIDRLQQNLSSAAEISRVAFDPAFG